MRTPVWTRERLIELLREDVWRYLTPAAAIEQQLLEASALLRMPPEELRDISQLQFLTSSEVGSLVAELPTLLRRLATTTTAEEEWSADRLRGSIEWGKTVSLRAATGIRHMYVTAPTQRAFQTPENELLVFVLQAIRNLGRRTGWLRGRTGGIAHTISHRVTVAERALQTRALSEVTHRPLRPTRIARIRSGRFRNRYATTLAAYEVYQQLVSRLNRDAIRTAVETHGLVTRDDATLFELLCTFRTVDWLRSNGWSGRALHLVSGGVVLPLRNGDRRLVLHYQHTPTRLRRVSRYGQIQNQHQITRGGLIPDLVIELEDRPTRFILVEIKGGPKRRVSQSARAALRDLLAYRRAFGEALATSRDRPYGIGVAWGAGLRPNHNAEIVLTSPDFLSEALASTVHT